MTIEDNIWIEFAVKILKEIDETDVKVPGALERLKLYYLRTNTIDLQTEIHNFCNDNNISYRHEFYPNSKFGKTHFVSFSYEGSHNCNASDDDLTSALVYGICKMYDILNKEKKLQIH